MENKFTPGLLKLAVKLEERIGGNGKVTNLTSELVYESNEHATKELFAILATAIESKDKYLLEISRKFYDYILKFYGFEKVNAIFQNLEQSVTNEIQYNNKGSKDNESECIVESLSELLRDLDELVGLTTVKDKINDLIYFQKVQKLRKQSNLSIPSSTLHLAFTGNPGTGKTTVARIVGRLYKELGLLTKGHFIEVSRTDLIAGYQGQTALKVKEVIDKARGGVLFIDEAYSITENEHSDSYGRECLTELTKALEDYRNDLVVIVAGYTEPMDLFFDSNPGLRSRFNTFIEFDDYSEAEILQIIEKLFLNNDYILEVGVRKELENSILSEKAKTKLQFANARFARNLYEKLVMNHARRVAKIDNPTISDLKMIRIIDVTLF